MTKEEIISLISNKERKAKLKKLVENFSPIGEKIELYQSFHNYLNANFDSYQLADIFDAVQFFLDFHDFHIKGDKGEVVADFKFISISYKGYTIRVHPLYVNVKNYKWKVSLT